MTTNSDVIVVGAGLFGSIVAKALRAEGASVTLLDCREAEAGSTPAACLIKPSWVSGLGKDVTEPAMDLLACHYHLQSIDFQVGPLRQPVWWVDPATILAEQRSFDRVLEIQKRRVVGLHDTYEASLVVVAAGVWTDRLLDRTGAKPSGVVGRAGVAFLFPQLKIDQPFISPWAPYRQLVAFNRGDGLWVSDGTAIKPENLDADRISESRARCMRAVEKLFPDIATQERRDLYGIRPYVSGAKPCYLAHHEDWLTVVTGGAKNGTISAAWAADQIVMG